MDNRASSKAVVSSAEQGRTAFGVALCFMLASGAVGALLRLQFVHPLAFLEYGHWLHTHSHIAFLGWVFNAFFALSMVYFVPEKDLRFYLRLFIWLQVAVIGMLLSFPFQGYGPVSIAFSTLHMVGAGVFAWRLWRNNRALPAVRDYLKMALIWLMASGLGPLTLGPLAAMGLRDTPAYHLAIYFYLHGQYNGWFMFFLQALTLQSLADNGSTLDETASRRAWVWFACGSVLTLAQSTLWLHPSVWVYVVAGVGGAAQLVGFCYFAKLLKNARTLFGGWAVILGWIALLAYLLKCLLQTAEALPVFTGLASNRFTVIAFLHLVFLGVVTPSILAWGLRLGWLKMDRFSSWAVASLVAGAVVTNILLLQVALGGGYCPKALLGVSLIMVLGVAGLVGSFWWTKRGILRPGL